MWEKIKQKIQDFRKVWKIINSDKYFILYSQPMEKDRIVLTADLKDMTTSEIKFWTSMIENAAEIYEQSEANIEFIKNLAKNGNPSNN